MNYNIIPAALIVTFLVTLLISTFTKRPLRGLWLFFVIIFLATWTGQLWITPFGPVGWGITWVPLFVIAIFFSFFILAIIPHTPPVKPREEGAGGNSAVMALDLLLWIIVILLVFSIAFSYYRLG